MKAIQLRKNSSSLNFESIQVQEIQDWRIQVQKSSILKASKFGKLKFWNIFPVLHYSSLEVFMFVRIQVWNLQVRIVQQASKYIWSIEIKVRKTQFWKQSNLHNSSVEAFKFFRINVWKHLRSKVKTFWSIFYLERNKIEDIKTSEKM